MRTERAGFSRQVRSNYSTQHAAKHFVAAQGSSHAKSDEALLQLGTGAWLLSSPGACSGGCRLAAGRRASRLGGRGGLLSTCRPSPRGPWWDGPPGLTGCRCSQPLCRGWRCRLEHTCTARQCHQLLHSTAGCLLRRAKLWRSTAAPTLEAGSTPSRAFTILPVGKMPAGCHGTLMLWSASALPRRCAVLGRSGGPMCHSMLLPQTAGEQQRGPTKHIAACSGRQL